MVQKDVPRVHEAISNGAKDSPLKCEAGRRKLAHQLSGRDDWRPLSALPHPQTLFAVS